MTPEQFEALIEFIEAAIRAQAHPTRIMQTIVAEAKQDLRKLLVMEDGK